MNRVADTNGNTSGYVWKKHAIIWKNFVSALPRSRTQSLSLCHLAHIRYQSADFRKPPQPEIPPKEVGLMIFFLSPSTADHILRCNIMRKTRKFRVSALFLAVAQDYQRVITAGNVARLAAHVLVTTRDDHLSEGLSTWRTRWDSHHHRTYRPTLLFRIAACCCRSLARCWGGLWRPRSYTCA